MANISDLRHRIKFQSLVLTTDGQGGYQEAWSDVAECWAEIKPQNGNERLFAQRIEDVYDHKITIRHRTDISTTQRILFGTRIFQIKSIQALDERKFFMLLKTQEKVGT